MNFFCSLLNLHYMDFSWTAKAMCGYAILNLPHELHLAKKNKGIAGLLAYSSRPAKRNFQMWDATKQMWDASKKKRSTPQPGPSRSGSEPQDYSLQASNPPPLMPISPSVFIRITILYRQLNRENMEKICWQKISENEFVEMDGQSPHRCLSGKR